VNSFVTYRKLPVGAAKTADGPVPVVSVTDSVAKVLLSEILVPLIAYVETTPIELLLPEQRSNVP